MTMYSNVAHVKCRAADCGAEYEQRVDPRAWEPMYRKFGALIASLGYAGLPHCCGVCGSRNVVVTEVRGPAAVKV
jgi:hypothetical protein